MVRVAEISYQCHNQWPPGKNFHHGKKIFLVRKTVTDGHRMFRMAGDIWGEYDQEGISFTLLTREKVGRYQVGWLMSGDMISFDCSSVGSGRHLCKVSRKEIAGLELTLLR